MRVRVRELFETRRGKSRHGRPARVRRFGRAPRLLNVVCQHVAPYLDPAGQHCLACTCWDGAAALHEIAAAASGAEISWPHLLIYRYMGGEVSEWLAEGAPATPTPP